MASNEELSQAYREIDQLRAEKEELLATLEAVLPYLPDANDAKNYAATNEGRAGQIHVVSIRARQLVHRIKTS